MGNYKKQSGMSLTEILVVISVIAILMGVSIPAAKQLASSFESGTGTRQLINAALSNARTIAVREQAYAGVRFQQASDKSGYYMIFIVHDKEATGDAYGFRAITGRKPMKLPEDVKVDNMSVVFSPQGKLTVHPVQCLRASANDTIFNGNGSSMFAEDGGQPDSRQSITIGSIKGLAASTTEYISPYTGELVMEYRGQKP